MASLLGSCATQERIPAALDARLDSALTAAGVPPLRKAKFTGPVTFQIGGTNNVATAIAKAKGPVASAPQASATAATAGLSWQVWAGLVLVAFAAGVYVRGKLKFSLPF